MTQTTARTRVQPPESATVAPAGTTERTAPGRDSNGRKIAVLRFLVLDGKQPAKDVDLNGAYLFGADAVPLRAEIEYRDGHLICKKRVTGPAGLALLREIDGVGRVLLETTRLQERDEPYVLSVELARGQMMRIAHKYEDWGLVDAPEAATVNDGISRTTDLLIAALQADSPAGCFRAGAEALQESVRLGETMTRLHAEIMLERRRETAGFSRHVFGCGVDAATAPETLGPRVPPAFDFANIPFHWKSIEPGEQKFNWAKVDAWVEWLAAQRVPMKGSGLVCFDEHSVPDWLYIWEHDYETVRDLVTEHIGRIVARYGNYIQAWDVISGIHAEQAFSFNFEQLMELTRVAAAVTKQLAPRSLTIVDLTAPWGEYYARNQRTIPPMLYAEMALQSGVQFDAFGLQFCFGAGVEGFHVRDMFQIASLVDRFGALGKPIHVTAVQVPSDTAVDKNDRWAGKADVKEGGAWREPWSERVQSEWLDEFCRTVLSRPFVDTVSWRDLSDAGDHLLPHGGLLNTQSAPKPAYQQIAKLRGELVPPAENP